MTTHYEVPLLAGYHHERLPSYRIAILTTVTLAIVCIIPAHQTLSGWLSHLHSSTPITTTSTIVPSSLTAPHRLPPHRTNAFQTTPLLFPPSSVLAATPSLHSTPSSTPVTLPQILLCAALMSCGLGLLTLFRGSAKTRGVPHWHMAMAAAGDHSASPGTKLSSITGQSLDYSITSAYAQCGIDAQELFEAYPSLQACTPKRARELPLFFQCLKVDLRKVLALYPEVIDLPNKQMKEVAKYLFSQKLSLPKVIERQPAVLGEPLPDLQQRVKFLEDLGLDVVKAVNRHPRLLLEDVEQVQQVANYLAEVGVDVSYVMTVKPQVVSFGVASLARTMAWLQQIGADAVIVANKFPNVFGLRIEDNMAPKVQFLSQEIGLKPTKITQFPQYLGLNLETRIRPRFLYLRSLNQPTTLQAMLISKDELFTKKVAKTPLKQYIEFKEELGLTGHANADHTEASVA